MSECDISESLGMLHAEIDRLRHDIERMQEIDSEHLAENDRLRAEVARLRERLEDNHVFELKDGQMVRVDVEPGSIPDGIDARNATIKLHDETIYRLRAENAELRAALKSVLYYTPRTYRTAQAAADQAHAILAKTEKDIK